MGHLKDAPQTSGLCYHLHHHCVLSFAPNARWLQLKPSTRLGLEFLAIHTGVKLAKTVKGRYQNCSTN